MTASHLWPVQTAVRDAILVAMQDLDYPVYDHTPTNPPDEFVRIDGFAMQGDDFKNAPRGRHSFATHFIHKPAHSQKRTKEAIAAIVTEMTQTKVEGESFSLEFIDFPTEGDAVAHGFARFTITLK